MNNNFVGALAALALCILVVVVVMAALWPVRSRRRRIEVRFVPYHVGEKLIREGWSLAKEEDTNHVFGWVWLEKLEDER
ncbi:MAG: hypothetical protein ABMA13_23035 [Chthoniobacteraceae bacterium]